MDRATADHMGMLGTVMNAMALMDAGPVLPWQPPMTLEQMRKRNNFV